MEYLPTPHPRLPTNAKAVGPIWGKMPELNKMPEILQKTSHDMLALRHNVYRGMELLKLRDARRGH